MQFKILQENLLRVLNVVAPAIGGKADPIITHNIRLAVSGDTLTATATNTAITITASTKAKVEEEGVSLVPPDFVKHIEALNPAVIIEVTEVRKSVVVEAGDAKTSMPIANSDDFPRKPQMDAEPTCAVFAGELRGAIQRGAYTTLSEKYDLRPVFAGIEFSLAESGLVVLSSNGNMAGVTALPAQIGGFATGTFSANVRAEGILPLASALSKENADALVYLHKSRTERHVGFVSGSIEYIATAQEQHHQPAIGAQLYDIRDGAKVRVTAGRRNLLTAMRLAKLTNPLVRLHITQDNVDLAATSEGGVRHNNSLGQCSADGNLKIAINAEMLAGALAVMDCTDVTLGFTEQLGPFTIIDTRREIPWVFGMSPLNVTDPAQPLTNKPPKKERSNPHG